VNLIYDHDAERNVIGAILLWPGGLAGAVETGLVAEHFFHLPHRGAFEQMLKADDAGKPIDTADFDPLIVDLVAGVPAVGNLHHYARKVVEAALWRSRQHAGYEIVQAAETRNEEGFARAEQSLLSGIVRPDELTYSTDALADAVLDHISKPAETFKWPFPRFDDLTSGGMRRGEVTLLGGWTSHGKSVLLDQCLEYARAMGSKVHLYINEMTPRMRTFRWVARQTGIPLEFLLKGELYDAQTKKVLDVLSRVPYPVTDAAGWSAPQIARHMRRTRADVVGIDILHLIAHRDERDLAEISHTLNVAAKRADCHLLATVHLNENRVMGQTRPLPTLGDIRGSGMLKNDADNVLFVFREQDADTGYPQHEGQAYFPKVRSGRLGGIPLKFDGARMEFSEFERWRAA
jgi:replicative DNA helicase